MGLLEACIELSWCQTKGRELQKSSSRGWPLDIHANHRVDLSFVVGAQNGSHRSPGDRIACNCSNVEGSDDGASPPMSQGEKNLF